MEQNRKLSQQTVPKLEEERIYSKIGFSPFSMMFIDDKEGMRKREGI